jgi:hypothetical protein
MNLEDIFKKFGIDLLDDKGNLRNLIDVLEDMYLKLNSFDFTKLMYEISEEEQHADIFDKIRGHRYGGQ